jgi:hypothetical protein
MTTRSHTRQRSGAALLISLQRRCYLAVSAADIPLSVISLFLGGQKFSKRALLQWFTASRESDFANTEQRTDRSRQPATGSPRPTPRYEKYGADAAPFTQVIGDCA